MIYTVKSNGNIVYDPNNLSSAALISGKYKKALNSSGSFEFTIPPSNSFTNIWTMKNVIRIYRDGVLVWKGRSTKSKRDFYNNRTFICEGWLSFLHDTIVEPFSKLQGGVGGLLMKVLEAHNNQSDDNHKIYLGRVSVVDYYDTVTDPNDGYMTCWDMIKKRLLNNDSLRGYIIPRIDADEKCYLDYINGFEVAKQEITYSKNLLDLNFDMDHSNAYSALMPVGTGNVTIVPLEDGDIDSDLYKLGYMVFSRRLVNRFGTIVKLQNFNTSDRTVLLNNAIHEMEQAYIPERSKLSAFDLNIIDGTIEAFDIGKYVKVNSAAHGITSSYLISELEVDLVDPSKSKITLGVN